MSIPKVTLCGCVCGGCTEGAVWRAWPRALLRGHSETTWGLTETHQAWVTLRCRQVFVLVVVIYFQVFCFSNLILTLLSDCELLTVLNLM